MFSLRTVDTSSHQPLLQEFDLVTREGLDRILGVPLTDVQWSQANLPVTLRGPGVGRRPADVLIPNWSQGRDAGLDVTVIHPLQEATVAGAAVEAGQVRP